MESVELTVQELRGVWAFYRPDTVVKEGHGTGRCTKAEVAERQLVRLGEERAGLPGPCR